jgi:hypothetical protein
MSFETTWCIQNDGFTEAKQQSGMLNTCKQLEKIQMAIHMFPCSLLANPDRQLAARGSALATRTAIPMPTCRVLVEV